MFTDSEKNNFMILLIWFTHSIISFPL